jgi:hypothetical protein
MTAQSAPHNRRETAKRAQVGSLFALSARPEFIFAGTH